MSSLTINVDDQIKEELHRLTKEDGVTITFIVNQFLKDYVNGNVKFTMTYKNEIDEYLNLSKKLTNSIEDKINSNSLPSIEEQLADI